MVFEMQSFTTNDGVELKYIDTLIEEKKEVPKKVLLLIHGFTGSSAVFKRNIPALSRNYRIIAPDLRGHGQSEKPESGYHVSRLAMDLRELIMHLEKQDEFDSPIVGLGASLGCAILWSYVELFTSSVFSHMIFVDQAPLQNSSLDGWDSRYCNRGMNNAAAVAALQTTLELNPEAAHLGTIATCLGYRWKLLGTDNITEETRSQDEQFFLGEAMRGNHNWFGKLMADHTALDWRDSIMDTLGPFSKSETKVLVVTSSRSGCFPAAGPLKVVELVNGDGSHSEGDNDRAKGVVVEWGGHWCYWEKPELFNKLILDFLDTKFVDMAESVVDKHIWTGSED